MAIIKRTIKLGTALGITYLTVEQRLWSQLSHKEISDKLTAFKNYELKALTFVTEKTGLKSTAIKQWIPTQESLEKNSINVKNIWNQSVKTSFRVLSQLNTKDLVTKLQQLMNKTK